MIILLEGPDSTGKTTLCDKLIEYFTSNKQSVVDDPPKIAGRYTQGCRNICEGDCAYAKPVRRAYKDGYNECNAYAKTIIKDLLDNSDEYARQRAEDFLKENK